MRLKLIAWPVGAGLVIALVVLWTGARSGPTSAPLVAGEADAVLKNATSAEFKIDGMYCSLCAANLERVLKEQPGVVAARVDFEKKLAVVSYDAQSTMTQQLENTIEETGVFHAELVSRALPKDNE